MTVPYLVWHNIDMRQAVGTSAACGLPIALVGAFGFAMVGWGEAELPAGSSGYLYWPAVLAISATSILGAPMGAWLAHRMLPYAFSEAGEEFPKSGIRLELMGPRYARWVYGPEGAENVVKGIAGEWCRIAVRRLDYGATSLKAEGDDAETALRVVRTY